jgi:hypothetical protein
VSSQAAKPADAAALEARLREAQAGLRVERNLASEWHRAADDAADERDRLRTRLAEAEAREFRQPCPACEGKGSQLATYAEGRGTRWVDCPDCRASGLRNPSPLLNLLAEAVGALEEILEDCPIGDSRHAKIARKTLEKIGRVGTA